MFDPGLDILNAVVLSRENELNTEKSELLKITNITSSFNFSKTLNDELKALLNIELCLRTSIVQVKYRMLDIAQQELRFYTQNFPDKTVEPDKKTHLSVVKK